MVEREDLFPEDIFIDEAAKEEDLFSEEVAESTGQVLPAISTKGKKRYEDRMQRSEEEDYWLGGFDLKNLDKKFYKTWIKQAQEMDIDPYFYVAHTIKELGGVRKEGYEQERFRINPQSTAGRYIQKIGQAAKTEEDVFRPFKYTGREAMEEGKGGYGAGALLIDDPVGVRAGSRSLYMDLWNEEIGSGDPAGDIYNPDTALNRASMYTLKYLYDKDLKSLSEGASAEVFQRTNPGEKDYGEHMNTIYQGLKTDPDYQWIRDIINE